MIFNTSISPFSELYFSTETSYIYGPVVLQVKHKTKSTDEMLRPRLLERGFQQNPGIGFKEIFEPFENLSPLRMLLANDHSNGLQVTQCDVNDGVPNGMLDETKFMKQPEGVVDTRRPHQVCILKKSL